MKNTLKISLKPNEKIYLNGAVIRVDRKVTLELLNDVQFLLESHVMQIDEASTPLRQLYFILQVMLMNPTAPTTRTICSAARCRCCSRASATRKSPARSSMSTSMVGEGHVYEALKALRGALPARTARAQRSNDDNPPEALQARAGAAR